MIWWILGTYLVLVAFETLYDVLRRDCTYPLWKIVLYNFGFPLIYYIAIRRKLDD